MVSLCLKLLASIGKTCQVVRYWTDSQGLRCCMCVWRVGNLNCVSISVFGLSRDFCCVYTLEICKLYFKVLRDLDLHFSRTLIFGAIALCEINCPFVFSGLMLCKEMCDHFVVQSYYHLCTMIGNVFLLVTIWWFSLYPLHFLSNFVCLDLYFFQIVWHFYHGSSVADNIFRMLNPLQYGHSILSICFLMFLLLCSSGATCWAGMYQEQVLLDVN